MTPHRSTAIPAQLAAASVIGASLLACGGAHAQAPYPVKPIRMVLVSPPGGSTDIIGRVLAQHIAEGLGQAIVVDNKPGGGGLIAAETTAKAAPDGYTLLYTHTSHAVTPSLHRKLPYDPIADFAPVSIAVLAHSVLVVHPAMPVKSVKDLLAHAKASPGKVNFSAGSTGASAHLGGELVHGTPQELGAHIKAQIAKWAPVVKSAGIRAD